MGSPVMSNRGLCGKVTTRIAGPRCLVCGVHVDNPDKVRTIHDSGEDDLCALHRAAKEETGLSAKTKCDDEPAEYVHDESGM